MFNECQSIQMTKKIWRKNGVFRDNNVLKVMYLSTYSIEFYVHCAIKSMYRIDWYILLENLIISSSFLFWSHILQDYCSAFIYMERKLKGDIIHFFLPFQRNSLRTRISQYRTQEGKVFAMKREKKLLCIWYWLTPI